MLSYFEDKDEQPDFIELARKEITFYANKGIIPQWQDFSPNLPPCDQVTLQEIKDLFQKIVETSFLEKILQTSATEFIFHSPFHAQKILHTGAKETFELEIDPKDWQLWLEILSIRYKENWNVETPFASFYGKFYDQQFRFSLIHESTSPDRYSKLFLRKISETPIQLSHFGETSELISLVQGKKNILIAGSTGSGKTSLLTSLLQLTNPSDHTVILEDTHEIIFKSPHATRLLSGSSPQKDLASYLSYALRMTPDRIILGEMRSHEVVPYLLAMNTGHRGVMSTIHASSAVDALYRLSLLFSLYSSLKQSSQGEIMELICRSLEFVVFMDNKKVAQIIKIYGSENGVPYYDEVKLATP